MELVALFLLILFFNCIASHIDHGYVFEDPKDGGYINMMHVPMN
jgi:hypothetical protein